MASNSNSINNNNNNNSLLLMRRRYQRQHGVEPSRRIEMPLMLPMQMQMPMVIRTTTTLMTTTTRTTTTTTTTTMTRTTARMSMPMELTTSLPLPLPTAMSVTMSLPLPLPLVTVSLFTQMERSAARQQPMLHMVAAAAGGGGIWGTMAIEGQVGDVDNIGDNNHVVGIPTVLPFNQMAHMGGGDAEMMLEARRAPQHRGAGDGIQVEVMQAMQRYQQQPLRRRQHHLVIQPTRRETLEQRHERSVQQILRLCDFIQQQLATIAAQIDDYERKLTRSQPNEQSPSPPPPEPDGDVV